MSLTNIVKTKKISELTKPELIELQSLLAKQGYPLKIDGIYGTKTQEQFNKFKKDKGLTNPDLIGVLTVRYLMVDDEEKAESVATQGEQAKPNKSRTIDWTNMNSAISKWFVVGEAFHYQNARYTNDTMIRNRIVVLAKELDKIRDEWGSGIVVTSWYRPPAVNKTVGGVSNSRHLYGDGVDIAPIKGSIQSFQSYVDKGWYGALGYGAKKGFVHLDMRNGKGWRFNSGAKGTRWNY